MPDTFCTGEYCSYFDEANDQSSQPMVYSISAQQVSRHVWVFRSHEGPNGRYGDPWVGFCLMRAERFVQDNDLAAQDSDEPRLVAHLFATVGRYAPSVHRQLIAILRSMGFTKRYHERLRDGVLVVDEIDLTPNVE